MKEPLEQQEKQEPEKEEETGQDITLSPAAEREQGASRDILEPGQDETKQETEHSCDEKRQNGRKDNPFEVPHTGD